MTIDVATIINNPAKTPFNTLPMNAMRNFIIYCYLLNLFIKSNLFGKPKLGYYPTGSFIPKLRKFLK